MDIQSQIDDLNSRLDDNDSSLQDYTDQNDSNVSDIQNTLNDQQTSLDDLNNSSGQLTFPLSQDSIDLINEQAPSNNQYLVNNSYIGTAILGAGSIVVNSNYVSVSSLILLSRVSIGGVTSATAAYLTYVPSAGSFKINSTSATDVSNVIYFILS